jgi:hypothetical protein
MLKVVNMNSDIDIQVQDIDHLGLIAGIIDDIGIKAAQKIIQTVLPEQQFAS